MTTEPESNHLRASLLALKQLRQAYDALDQSRREPIAILGVGCRFPGGVEGPESFWNLLCEGRDATSEIPSERWDIEAWYDPDPAAPGRMASRRGGFLTGIDQFDAEFFGISPREAALIDPQQRLVLEVAWEALEHASLAAERLAGTAVGVFLGLCGSDYAHMTVRPDAPEGIDAYTSTGAAASIAAGRLSYTLGLRGPSLVVDTACSSSLVSVHIACQSLRNRECHLALAGGVNLILSPLSMIALSKLRALSPSDRCRPFDASADGYVRGEGCGLVVLKRLDDARRDGDPILAVIRGSAVNHDGRTQGLTAPSGPSQTELIREALRSAGVSASQVGYVEAHGTGTPLGDPIEAAALNAALQLPPADAPTAASPVYLGSVKSNIGHLEGAAGAAGLIKAALAVERGAIPPHLHQHKPSPHIPWERSRLTVPLALTVWPASDGPRTAGVSAFGFSGTNAHVVLQQPPESPSCDPRRTDPPVHVLTISAKEELALRTLASRWAKFLESTDPEDWPDACYTSHMGRSHLSHRLAIIAGSPFEAAARLEEFAACRSPAREGLSRGIAAETSQIGVAFVYPDRLDPAPIRDLSSYFPALASAFERCRTVSRPQAPSGVNGSEVGSIAASVVAQYCLAELWRSFGVEPSIMLGTGPGAIAAACVAGALSLDEAVALAQRLDGAGANGRDRFYRFLTPKSRVVSATTGLPLTAADDPDAWWASCNVGGTGILPEPGARALRGEQGAAWWISLGPVPAPVRPEGGPEGGWLPAPDDSGRDWSWSSLIGTLATLFVRGVAIDWTGFHKGGSFRRLRVPRYPFQRRRAWAQAARPHPELWTSTRAASGACGPSLFAELLGRRLPSPYGVQFETQLHPAKPAFLGEHRVYQHVVVPAAAFMGMAFSAAWASDLGEGPWALEAVEIPSPLILGGDHSWIVQTVVTPDGPESARFRISSRPDGRGEDQGMWTTHCTGLIRVRDQAHSDPKGESLEAMRVDCEAVVDAGVIYDRARRLGFDFGPSFRGIEQLWRGRGRALGRIRTHESIRPKIGFLGIHPAVLDSCLQVVGATLPDENLDSSLYMPIGLERYELWSDPSDRLWSQARLRPDHNPHGVDGEVYVADVIVSDESGRTVARVSGLQIKRARPGSLDVAARQPIEDWLYEIRWLPKRSATSEAFEFPSPSHVADRVRPLAEASVGRLEDQLSGLASGLEALGAAYITEALVRLGYDGNPAGTSPTEVAQRLCLPERHHRLLGRLLEFERGAASHGARLKADAPVLAEQLRSQYPSCTQELSLLENCGNRLADVLRGEIDPLELLFPNGSTSIIATLYQESPLARIINDVVRDAVAQALASFPSDRLLRVLEVGAGTGGTTSAILPILPEDRVEYTFTDVSPLFLFHAREKFRDRPFLRYQILDLDASPNSQSSSLGSFDIVLAANVLHATRDLRRTLDRVRRLLAPGGMFVLLETVGRQIWADLVFGLTEGWWAFTDTVLRPTHPLLPAERWLELLGEEGYDEPVAVWAPRVHNDSSPQPLCQQAIFLARIPVADPTNATPVGSWLVVYSDQGRSYELALSLSMNLGTAGGSATLVTCEQAISALGFRDHAASRPGGRDQDRPWRGILYLIGIDPPLETYEADHTILGAADAVPDVEPSCRAVLDMVQTLARSEMSGSPRLWLVTNGAQAVQPEDPPPSPAATLIWGLGRTIEWEHPRLWGGLIDLDPFGTLADQAEELIEHVLKHERESQVACRGGRHHVARISRVESKPARTAEVIIRQDGRYLITGGFGPLGLAVARWLIENGARHLALLGRRVSDPSVYGYLTSAGAEVIPVAADVSRAGELTAALNRLASDGIPLRGVIHAAGVLDDSVLARLDWARFEAVLAPKTRGAWNLHRLTRRDPLDIFVLFSSAASLLGSPGQASHAAANAFLDGLAHRRRALGLPALSINWGTWSEVGAAARPEIAERVTRFGLGGIPTRDGIAAFQLALECGKTQVAVMPIDWRTFLGQFSQDAVPPLFVEQALALAAQGARGPKVSAFDSTLRRRLLDAPRDMRPTLLREHLVILLARLTGRESRDIDPTTPINQIGIDSLMGIEMKTRIDAELGISLPIARLLDSPSLVALVDRLLEELNGRSPDPLPGLLPHDVEALSDDEVDSLLRELIAAEAPAGADGIVAVHEEPA
jgi:microcystin synthetase protein McyD